jgi:hypothetical protein
MVWDIGTVTTLIGSLGFPIVVCWYTLTTLNKTLQENSKALDALKDIISQLCAQLPKK